MSPAIVIFACNWDGWSCVEAAANLGLQYPASVKIIRVRCLSRVHAGLILKAFEFGADGAMLLGCQPGSCHFGQDDKCVAGEYEKAQIMLEMLGIWKSRLMLVHLPAFDGHRFLAEVMELIKRIDKFPVSSVASKPGRGTKL